MCIQCAIELVTGLDLATDEGHEQLARLGRIPWPDVTDGMRECAALISALYAGEAGTGGPLHVVTDDDNVEDSSLAFARTQITNPSHPENYKDWDKVATISRWILDLMDEMYPVQRIVTNALAHGSLAEIHGKVYMPRTEFPIRETVYDDDGNAVGTRWGFRSRMVEAQ